MVAPNSKVADTSNLGELKSVCDENIKTYLTKQGYKENNIHSDILLAFGYIGASLSAIDFLYSWKFSFKATVWFSMYISIPVYIILTVLSFVYDRKIKKRCYYHGDHTNKEGNSYSVSVRTAVKGYDPTYHLDVFVTSVGKGGNKKEIMNSDKVSFGNCFYDSGELCTKVLEECVDKLINMGVSTLVD